MSHRTIDREPGVHTEATHNEADGDDLLLLQFDKHIGNLMKRLAGPEQRFIQDFRDFVVFLITPEAMGRLIELSKLVAHSPSKYPIWRALRATYEFHGDAPPKESDSDLLGFLWLSGAIQVYTELQWWNESMKFYKKALQELRRHQGQDTDGQLPLSPGNAS